MDGWHAHTVHMYRDRVRSEWVRTRQHDRPIRGVSRGEFESGEAETDAQHSLMVKQAPRWLAITILDVFMGVFLVTVWIVLLSCGQMQRNERVRLCAVSSTQLL